MNVGLELLGEKIKLSLFPYSLVKRVDQPVKHRNRLEVDLIGLLVQEALKSKGEVNVFSLTERVFNLFVHLISLHGISCKQVVSQAADECTHVRSLFHAGPIQFTTQLGRLLPLQAGLPMYHEAKRMLGDGQSADLTYKNKDNHRRPRERDNYDKERGLEGGQALPGRDSKQGQKYKDQIQAR